ncbi:MAG: UDP-2,3-diacylglucosamine diphosphatase [Cyanobacteria bacterium SZAS TMP-1]|nr:UDP-2,3-diacylglucosamine diphosphatase [Cyanobacteria bacterium SZAS TMP-1]
MNNLPADGHGEVFKREYRTIFISDIHLGTPGCQAGLLLDFLKNTECKTLYLIGDVVDGWRLKRRWYWPQAHNDVVQKLLRKARKGTKVVFVPGNHDEFAREYDGMVFGDIQVLNSAEHTTAAGKTILIIHGDEFDGVVRYHKWLAHLGSWAYDMTVVVNGWVNFIRRKIGLPYWSLSAFLKRRVKEAVKFITNFEETVARHAADRGFDAVICGHIHHPAMKEIEGVLYLNDGDWVETGSCVVEDFDGTLHVLKWRLNDAHEILHSWAAQGARSTA